MTPKSLQGKRGTFVGWQLSFRHAKNEHYFNITMIVFWLQVVNILGVLSVGTFEKGNILCGGYMAGACGRNLRTCVNIFIDKEPHYITSMSSTINNKPYLEKCLCGKDSFNSGMSDTCQSHYKIQNKWLVV